MIILEAHRKDNDRTGFRYSVRRHGHEPTATTDVVEAIRMLTDRGVDGAADLVEEARRLGRVEIPEPRGSR
jgi:hypothetical protein